MELAKEIDVGKNLLLKFPFSMVVAGSSGSGKTVLVRKILENFQKISSIDRPIRVLWCYGIKQDLHDQPLNTEHATVRYVQGFPEEADGMDVIILDDLQSAIGDDKRLADLFTRYSHHRKVAVFFIVQNLFLRAKAMRDVTLNATYLLLMSSRRDRGQITRLGTQLYPGEIKMFTSAYKLATERPFGYLLIDLSPTTEEQYRLRTNIVPEEYPIIIFAKNDGI